MRDLALVLLILPMAACGGTASVSTGGTTTGGSMGGPGTGGGGSRATGSSGGLTGGATASGGTTGQGTTTTGSAGGSTTGGSGGATTGGAGSSTGTAASGGSTGSAARPHCLLGTHSAPPKNSSTGVVVNRSCGQPAIDCEEATIGSGFHYASDRVYQSWGSLSTAEWDDDLANGRLSIWDVVSPCASGVTWPAIAQASATSTGSELTLYQTIKGMGDAVASWAQSAQSQPNTVWKGKTYFAFFHEPTVGSSACSSQPAGSSGFAKDWRDAYQNIARIWTNDSHVTSLEYGVILVGNSVSQWQTFWPANDPWMGSTLTWAAADPYNWSAQTCYPVAAGGHCMEPNGTICACGPCTTWRSFATASSSFKTWATGGAQYGHPTNLKEIITETGTCEGASTTGPGSKAQWFSDMASFIQSSWPELFALTYYDTYGNCPRWIDSSQAAWNSWVTVAQSPYFK
ncbi:MAG: hypothetical protein ACYCWW_01265 [Deltaproteobacteria bacterium]